MSSRSAITNTLSSDDRSPRGQYASPRDSATAEHADGEVCAQWFNEAARAFGSGKEVAFTLGVDPSFVTALKTGAKSVGLKHIVPLLRNPDAASALLGAMCRFAGFAPPRAPRRVKRQEIDRQLVLQMRKRAPQLFDLFSCEIAAELGADVDEVRDAWVETNDVRPIDE